MDRANRVARLTERFVVASSGGFLVWYICAKIAAWPWGASSF